ncbi:MAG TPA: hypothetical protein VIY09_03965, partial [Rhizomicrobium sp.]
MALLVSAHHSARAVWGDCCASRKKRNEKPEPQIEIDANEMFNSNQIRDEFTTASRSDTNLSNGKAFPF